MRAHAVPAASTSPSSHRDPSISSFVDILRRRAREQPGDRIYTFLDDGEDDESSLTNEELDRRARAIAAFLQSKGSPGDRVVLLYPPGLEFVAAFLACLYAGFVAVPAYPPDPHRLNRTLPRFLGIVRDSGAAFVLTDALSLSLVGEVLGGGSSLGPATWLASEAISDAGADSWREPDLDGESLAMLQYTSGSTSAPKGVMISHGNLLHNSAFIHSRFRRMQALRGIIWLPPYHDMGLIGGVLQPLYGGFPVTLMSPLAFLQRPLRWLQAISRRRGTASGGPNFAYDLCVRKISRQERRQLDLGCWDLAFNGSERVSWETLDRFAATFAECGFRREAFYPCYGLAEATLFVSGALRPGPPVAARLDAGGLRAEAVVSPAGSGAGMSLAVGCGSGEPGVKIAIVDPHSRLRCAPGCVGEIWVAGGSVTKGYWEQPAETAAAFSATIANTGEGPFLRTGDLGLMLDGELFPAGRLKDVIVVRGRNVFPQDLESVVERSHAALRPGCCAAFAIERCGVEGVSVAAEIERRFVVDGRLTVDPDDVVTALCRAVGEAQELSLASVLLLKPGALPKTSSGKIRRSACRELAAQPDSEVLALWAQPAARQGSDAQVSQEDPGDAERWVRDAIRAAAPAARSRVLEGYLREQVARVLGVGVAKLSVHQPLDAAGIDSLALVELTHGLELELGVPVQVERFCAGHSIASVAADLLPRLFAEESPKSRAAVA
jgi:acyl-CoA synthetase (AMP-forming)/AMP-acid ligase II/acyl carrier protein